MFVAALYGNFTPVIKKSVSPEQPLQQAANGETNAYRTAARMPMGQANARRIISHINDHIHPKFAILLTDQILFSTL